MNNDLISREAAIEQIERRIKYLVGDKGVSPEAFIRFLRNRPAVDAVEVVRCKDCAHRGIAGRCPMCHDETYDDDGYTEWYTIDNTGDDGFCHCGAKMDLED